MSLAGNPECKRPLGKSRFRREDTAKNYLKERGLVDLDCFHLIQDRDKKRSLLKTLTTFSFSSSSSSSSLPPPPLPLPRALQSVVELLIKYSSISSDLLPTHANFSFPLPSVTLRPHQSIYSVVDYFSLFLPF
jgi:hypothetical protein